MVNWYIG